MDGFGAFNYFSSCLFDESQRRSREGFQEDVFLSFFFFWSWRCFQLFAFAAKPWSLVGGPKSSPVWLLSGPMPTSGEDSAINVVSDLLPTQRHFCSTLAPVLPRLFHSGIFLPIFSFLLQVSLLSLNKINLDFPILISCPELWSGKEFPSPNAFSDIVESLLLIIVLAMCTSWQRKQHR